MRKFVVVTMICFFFAGMAKANLWEINDSGLQDQTNFIDTSYGTDGTLVSRCDISGNPGTQFQITLSGENWQDITIGDNFDLPGDNSGITLACGNGGDLSNYDGFTMTVYNPGTEAFLAGLYMNTGWTDSSETNRYYQSGDGSMAWVGPGQEATLFIDFSDAALWCDPVFTTGNTVSNLDHVTDIGFKIGANLGNQGEVCSGQQFAVNVVPEPATMLLLVAGSLIGLRRKG